MPPPQQTVPFDALVETLLQRAVDSGLKPPIVVVLVAVNGFVSAVRYVQIADGGWDGTLLVEGTEAKGKFPLNLVFCDMNGRSITVLVNDLNSLPAPTQ